MEVAVIDWKTLDSRFVKDELYEHINAPKWVDFSAADDPVDDQAWFCRPNCDHPKTAEDFLNQKERTPNSNSKLQRSASVSDIPPFGDRNKRDTTLKKRGINQPSTLNKDNNKYHRIIEDGENQDPNFSTPPLHKAKAFGKEAFKCSTEKKPIKEQTPKLRSTLSARNLFAGGDLLNKVAEFCNELKKLATRPRDKENVDDVEKEEVEDYKDENIGVSNEREKERKPFLELNKEKSVAVEKSGGSKGQLRRKKRNDDAENTPIGVDLKNIKNQETQSLLQIRTCPPTPQCFSANRATPKAATPPTPFRQRPLNQDRGILQEMKPMNKVEKEEKIISNGGGREVAEKEARSLDVFWFLKPCTLSS